MTREVIIIIFKTHWAKAGALSHNSFPRPVATAATNIKSPVELDKPPGSEQSKGRGRGGQTGKTKTERAAVSWSILKMQRGVVILPDHVLARAGCSPAQCNRPHSGGSGASCGSVSPGHGFWPSAQHWPFGSHMVLHTQSWTRFLFQLKVTLGSILLSLNMKYQDMTLIQHKQHWGSTQCDEWEHSVWGGSPGSALSALTSPRGHQVEGSFWQR